MGGGERSGRRPIYETTAVAAVEEKVEVEEGKLVVAPHWPF